MAGLDLLGQKFGRLTVIARAENTKHGQRRWHCKCECGGAVIVAAGDLRRGTTKSCGCLHSEVMKAMNRRRQPSALDYERWDHLAEFDEWPS